METMKEKNRFLQLLEYMKEGWEIDEPVLAGAMWYTGVKANDSTYHFVLRNKAEDQTSLLSLPSSPQLLAFLSEQSLQVNSI
jgi:hypothetical protein